MSTSLRNLDRIILDRGLDSRIEMSATMAELVQHLDAEAPNRIRSFERAGLGPWSALAVEFVGSGEVVFAVPEEIEDAGCSIYFRQTPTLTELGLARLIAARFPSEPPLFCRPDGTLIELLPVAVSLPVRYLRPDEAEGLTPRG